ncbi:MAG: hypothetical protein E7503_08025 [Ruminococcus sp.]|nr:hypothetical protein [Ruminococcus sp.]
MWTYIILKFEEKQNEYGLSTLLQVIQYTTRLFEKDKAQKIIINILRNGNQPSYITSLALKALININQCSDDYLDEILSILNDVVDIRIIKVIFDIISLSCNPDKYYEYVINKFEIKKRNEIYIEFEHSFINVLYSLKETKSILAWVVFLCEVI